MADIDGKTWCLTLIFRYLKLVARGVVTPLSGTLAPTQNSAMASYFVQEIMY